MFGEDSEDITIKSECGGFRSGSGYILVEEEKESDDDEEPIRLPLYIDNKRERNISSKGGPTGGKKNLPILGFMDGTKEYISGDYADHTGCSRYVQHPA